eukprot:scaffold60132_cov27-Tisochrysis_lutea.AAC.4
MRRQGARAGAGGVRRGIEHNVQCSPWQPAAAWQLMHTHDYISRANNSNRKRCVPPKGWPVTGGGSETASSAEGPRLKTTRRSNPNATKHAVVEHVLVFADSPTSRGSARYRSATRNLLAYKLESASSSSLKA